MVNESDRLVVHMSKLFCFRIKKDSMIGDRRYIYNLFSSLEISRVKDLRFI
jgi:hypothetical protein